MNKLPTRKKVIAITTAFLSVLIGVVYLFLITILDSRGPLLPPPPEAFGSVVIVLSHYF